MKALNAHPAQESYDDWWQQLSAYDWSSFPDSWWEETDPSLWVETENEEPNNHEVDLNFPESWWDDPVETPWEKAENQVDPKNLDDPKNPQTSKLWKRFSTPPKRTASFHLRNMFEFNSSLEFRSYLISVL